MADGETLTLLSSSKFVLPIAGQRNFDIEVVLSPPTIELFDIEIVLIPPNRESYDILIELVRELDIDETSYENFKKSDLSTSYNYISNYNQDSQTFDQSLIDGNLASIVNVSKLLGVPATSNLVELKKALQSSQLLNFPLSDKFYVFKSDNLNIGVLSSNIYNPFLRVKARIVYDTNTTDNNISTNSIYTFGEFFDISSYEVKSFIYYLSQELNKKKETYSSSIKDIELFIEFSFFTDRTITFSFDYNDVYFDLFYTGATGRGINSPQKTLVKKSQKITLYSGLHNFILKLKPEKFPISSLTDSSYSVYLNVKNENLNTEYLSLNPFNLNTLQIVNLTKFSTFSLYDFLGKSPYSDLGLFLKFIDKELRIFDNSLGLLLPTRKYFFKSVEENPLLNTSSSVDLSNETFLFYYKPQFANIVIGTDTETETTFEKLLPTNPTLIEVDLYDGSKDKKTITETRKTTYHLTIYNPSNEKVGTDEYYSSDQVKRLLFSFHNFNYQEIKNYKENEDFSSSVLNNTDNYLFDFLTNETTSIALNETEQNDYFFPTYNNSFLYSSTLYRVVLSYLSSIASTISDERIKSTIDTVIETTVNNDENEKAYLLDETKLDEIFTSLQSAKEFLLNETGNENTTRFRNLRFHYEVVKPSSSSSEGENVRIYETLLQLINSSKYGLKFDIHFSAHGDKYLSTSNYGNKLLVNSLTPALTTTTTSLVSNLTGLINELTTVRVGLEIRDSSNNDELVKRYYFTSKDYDYVSNNLVSNYDYIDLLRNRPNELIQQLLSSLLNTNDNNTDINLFDYIIDDLSSKLKNLFTASIEIYSSNNYNGVNSFGFLISRQQLLNTLLISELNEFSISVSIKPRYKLFTQDLIKLLENNPSYYISSIFVEIDGFNNSAGTIPFLVNQITTSMDFHSYSPKVISLFTSNKEKQSSSNTSTIDFSDVLLNLYNEKKNKGTNNNNFNSSTAIIEAVNYLKTTSKLDYSSILKNLVHLQFYNKLINDYKLLFTAGNLLFLDIEKTETQTIYRVFSNIINTNIVLYTNYFVG